MSEISEIRPGASEEQRIEQDANAQPIPFEVTPLRKLKSPEKEEVVERIIGYENFLRKYLSDNFVEADLQDILQKIIYLLCDSDMDNASTRRELIISALIQEVVFPIKNYLQAST